MEITSVGQSTGEPVIGSIEATLAWRATYLDPWQTMPIEGDFTAIRRLVP